MRCWLHQRMSECLFCCSWDTPGSPSCDVCQELDLELMWSGAACRFLTQPTSMFTRFKKIYGIQAGGNAFERPDDLLKWVDLYDLTQKTMQQQLVVSSCPCTLLCLFWPLQAFPLMSLMHGGNLPITNDQKVPNSLVSRMHILSGKPIDKTSSYET